MVWSGKSGSTVRACPQWYQSKYFMKQSSNCLFNVCFFHRAQCRSNINKYDCGILSIGHEFINKMWFPGWQLCTYSTGILENLLQQGLYKKDRYARSSCLVLAPSCSIIKLDLMFLGVCKISTHLYSIEATQIFMKNCQCFVKSAYL